MNFILILYPNHLFIMRRKNEHVQQKAGKKNPSTTAKAAKAPKAKSQKPEKPVKNVKESDGESVPEEK